MTDKKQKVLNKFYYKRNIFRLIEGFVNVVRCNGISKAANKMDLSPSVVSTQIATLEKEFGVCLMKRKSGVKFITLTKEGETFYDAVNRIFVALDQTIENLHTDFIEYRNTVRIACHPLIATLIVPEMMEDMMKQYPSVRFIVREIPYEEALKDMKDGHIDVAMYSKEMKTFTDNKDIKVQKLWKYHATTFCHPQHSVAKTADSEVLLVNLMNNTFIGLVATGYTVEKAGDILLDRKVAIKVSYGNVLATVKATTGVTVTDKRIMKIANIEGLIVKDTPQIAQDAYFCIVTNKDSDNKFLPKCINTMMKIAKRIDEESTDIIN